MSHGPGRGGAPGPPGGADADAPGAGPGSANGAGALPRQSRARIEWPRPGAGPRWTLAGIGTFFVVLGVVPAVALTGTRVASVVFFAAQAGLVVWGVVAVWRRRARARERERTVAAGRPSFETDWTASRETIHLRSMHLTTGSRSYHATTIGALVLALTVMAGMALRTDAALFVTAGLAVVVAVLALAWSRVRGGLLVRFATFPFSPGGPVRLFVATTTGSPRLAGARFLLRCWRYEPRRRKAEGGPVHVLWSAECARPPRDVPGPDEFVEVRFDVPAGLPPTRNHGWPLVRWDLVVVGRSRWGQVVETIPVPVYDPGPPPPRPA